MIKETSAGVILFRRDEKKDIVFLLLHYISGHWDFVKGKVENNESIKKAAIRETNEETGITDIMFVENFEEWIDYEFMYKGNLVRKKVVFFLAETKTKNVTLSNEHSEYVWTNHDQSLKSITFDNTKKVLTKVHMLLETQ